MIGLLLVLSAPVSACGGDPTSSGPPTASSATVSPVVDPTPSPRSSAPASPLPPAMPAAARKHTLVGAKAFTRYFVATANYAIANLDPPALAKLFHPVCAGCKGALAFIRSVKRRGGDIRGSTWSIRSITGKLWLINGEQRVAVIHLRLHVAPETIVIPGKRDVEHHGGKQASIINLMPTKSGWKIARLGTQ
ncbi:MAG: DUF6318 family protein [Nocardioides sp.]|uniref:DUF6318 family protein n=1 Tax=Nocardioides sp. TaxID=35761 RepID=UPI0039E25258